MAERLAVRAVLARAAHLVGPLRGATRPVREPLAGDLVGEFDVEATLERALGKPYPEDGDWIVEHRIERRHQVVLMMDTSLSMAGEKMALAAVAAAVLALNLAPGDLAVVLFADDARTVVRLHEEVSAAELVRRMLDTPCGGATNVAAALELGCCELARGRDPRRCGLLVSDGLYTAGSDPRPVAARYRTLHVLLTHDVPVPPHPASGSPLAPQRSGGDPAAVGGSPRRYGLWIAPHRSVGPDVARAGGGRLVWVEGMTELPRRMLDLADHLLR